MVLMRVSELAQRSGVAATILRSHGSSWSLPLDKAGRLLGALAPGPVKEN